MYFVRQNGPMSDIERLELYEKLEKAEGRIVALEKQVCCTVVVKTSLQGHSASKMSTSPSHSSGHIFKCYECTPCENKFYGDKQV